MLVLVQGPAKPVAPSHAQVNDLIQVGDRLGLQAKRRALREAPVWPVAGGVGLELTQRVQRVSLALDQFAVQRLVPNGADPALYHRVHPRHAHAGAHENATSSEEFECWDTALHHSFATATHNSVLVDVSALLIAARRQSRLGNPQTPQLQSPAPHHYCSERQRIVDAVRDRDPETARQAMRDHFVHVRNTLFGGTS